MDMDMDDLLEVIADVLDAKSPDLADAIPDGRTAIEIQDLIIEAGIDGEPGLLAYDMLRSLDVHGRAW